MSKTLKEAVLSTRNARSKLREGVHWRGIDADVHLGYRRGKRGGRWLVRWYGGNGKYQQETIGAADDALDADGVQCLSFEQARSAAGKLVVSKRAEAIAAAEGPAPRVRTAVEAYLAAREARGVEGKKRDARLRLTKHVLASKIAAVHLHALTETDLENWRAGLDATLATATVRRIVNDFKAALNAAGVRHRAKLPAQYGAVVKNGLAAGEVSPPTARDAQALSDDEVRRIITAAAKVDHEDGWEGDLLRIVLTLGATGARFSQVARMKVADVQPQQGRLMVPTSRKGRGKKKASHIAVRVGTDVLSALWPAITGRRGNEPLFERWRHKQVPREGSAPPRWVRDVRGPWLNSTELQRPWQKIIRKAELPADVVPYALRHSAIVRQLRAGLPVRLVAALHDTSTAMIESHYSAAIVDALDGLAAGAVVPLVVGRDDNVVRLRG